MSTEADSLEMDATEAPQTGAGRRYPLAASLNWPMGGGSCSATVARFYGFDGGGEPLVCELPGRQHEPVRARTTVALMSRQVGAEVLVVFEQGNPLHPIVIGVLQERGAAAGQDTGTAPGQVRIQADTERLVISAEREVVLRCGDASLTLTRAGKVIIQGKYVLSRSSGYNKIKGAVVDIN
jgi:hypothetical protein